MEDLVASIDKSGCYCLNEQTNAPFANLFQGDDRLMLKSDADEQLMIHIAFQSAVKLHSINMVSPSSATDNAPRILKLFVNRENLGFSDAEDIEPTQVIELSAADLSPDVTTELKFVKFQRVQTLTIFVEENAGGADETWISGLKFFGQSMSGTNMNDLKKAGHDHE